MATLPPLASDLAAWVGESIEDTDPRAEAVLSAATALVRGYAGQAWDDDATPDDVWAVVIQVAARVWFNPQGLIRDSVDDYSRAWADGGESGVYLTSSERDILSRYRTSASGLWVQPITSGTLETPLDDLFLRDLAYGDASGTYLPPVP